MDLPYLRREGDRLLLELHAVPRASKTRVVGEHGGRLKVQVAAPPVDGEANRELVQLFARGLGLPRSAVTIVQGASGRRKTIALDGADEAVLRAWLAG